MPRHISLIFPGQGSQSIGMLDGFPSEFINKHSVDIKSAIGFDLIKTISKGQQKLIDQTSITQPAILFTSYLYFKMITEELKVKPNILCGHSLGEYSALTCANSIPIFNALRLVHNRGLLMERARKGSMYAVLNFDLKKIKQICKDVEKETGLIVSPANINSKNQIVIAGNIKSTNIAVKRIKREGAKRIIKLSVSVASHCNLMKRPANFFIKDLNKANLKMPDLEILHNTNAKISKNINTLKNNLVNQLIKPVKWMNTMDKIKESNGIVIECGPGNVLTGIARSNGIKNVISSSSPTFKSDLENLL